MAQFVRYFEDNVTYTEGPFVAVDINGYRIEVELKGWKCPVLPDSSIYSFMRRYKILDGKTENKGRITKAVDWLNNRVKEGKIVLHKDGWWEAVPELHDIDEWSSSPF